MVFENVLLYHTWHEYFDRFFRLGAVIDFFFFSFFFFVCEQNVVKILGLKFNHDYQDTKSLRYGHLMIMTDQDHDGSHIKGKTTPICAHVCPVQSV